MTPLLLIPPPHLYWEHCPLWKSGCRKT